MIRRDGFTLIELMIVVVIVGILLTIAVPNFVRMRSNSLDAQIKSNTHTVQLVAEDFAVRNDGAYSDLAADLMPLMPGGGMLENAYTNLRSEPQFAAAPAAAGEIGVRTVMGAFGVATGYVVEGMGKDGIVLSLTSGN